MTVPADSRDARMPSQPERGGVFARGVAFWLDSLLLTVAIVALNWLFPLTILHNQLIFMGIVGVYRVIGEYFFGRTIAKALISMRVLYRDPDGLERRGADRLVFVIARNSWLLIGFLVWFWTPDQQLGWLIFVLFVSLAFTQLRATVMDLLAGARVIDTKDEWPR